MSPRAYSPEIRELCLLRKSRNVYENSRATVNLPLGAWRLRGHRPKRSLLRLCDVPIPRDAPRNSSWLEQAQRDGILQGSYIEH